MPHGRDAVTLWLAGIADRNPDVTTPADIPLYQSLEQMLVSQKLDVLDIVVPPDAHCRLIETAIDADISHIICQKPFCQSLEQAEYITAKAEAAGISLVIHENFRFQPWYRLLKSKIETGAFGQIYQFGLPCAWAMAEGLMPIWRASPIFRRCRAFLV